MRSLSLALATAVAGVVCAASAQASPVPLGAAAGYAVLGTGGTSSALRSDFEVYQSATVVNGNVGSGPYSTFTHGFDCTINGALNYDTTDSAPTVTGTITGGVHQISMSTAAADARSASDAAAALTPTSTVTTLTEGDIIGAINGVANQTVIRVTDQVTLKTTYTIRGDPGDTFVFQLVTTKKDALVLSGVIMTLEGGISADNILWNLNGASDIGDVSISSGTCLVYGTFLAPDRNVTVDNADVFGRVIGGGSGQFLSIHSSSLINFVPEPTTLGVVAMSGLMLLRRQRKAV